MVDLFIKFISSAYEKNVKAFSAVAACWFENNKNSTLSVTAVTQPEAGLEVASLAYPFHKVSKI